MMNKNIFINDLAFLLNDENKYHIEKLKYYSLVNGYNIVDKVSKSNYIIILTCGYFSDIEDITFNYVKKLIDYGYKGKIIVYGELVGTTGKIESIKSSNLFFVKVNDEYLFDLYLDDINISYEDIDSRHINHDNIETCDQVMNFNVRKNKRYFILVQRGCIHSCTYCAIKKSIGYVKSKPLKKIIDEVTYAVSNNYKEIVFWGEDIGSYGLDIGLTFVDLIKNIHNIKGDFSLFIHFFEPSLYIKYFEFIKDYLGIVNTIQLGIQSFNDRILKLMNRKYKVSDVIRIINETRKINKNIFIENQIIYAYPTETREEFLINLKYAKTNLYNLNTFHPFSYRKGFGAYKKDDFISEEEVKYRSYILYRLVKKNKYGIDFSWSRGGTVLNLEKFLEIK